MIDFENDLPIVEASPVPKQHARHFPNASWHCQEAFGKWPPVFFQRKNPKVVGGGRHESGAANGIPTASASGRRKSNGNGPRSGNVFLFLTTENACHETLLMKKNIVREKYELSTSCASNTGPRTWKVLLDEKCKY